MYLEWKLSVAGRPHSPSRRMKVPQPSQRVPRLSRRKVEDADSAAEETTTRTMGCQTSASAADLDAMQEWRTIQAAHQIELHHVQHRIHCLTQDMNRIMRAAAEHQLMAAPPPVLQAADAGVELRHIGVGTTAEPHISVESSPEARRKHKYFPLFFQQLESARRRRGSNEAAKTQNKSGKCREGAMRRRLVELRSTDVFEVIPLKKLLRTKTLQLGKL